VAVGCGVRWEGRKERKDGALGWRLCELLDAFGYGSWAKESLVPVKFVSLGSHCVAGIKLQADFTEAGY